MSPLSTRVAVEMLDADILVHRFDSVVAVLLLNPVYCWPIDILFQIQW
jgi:hypothetical protein